MQLMRVVSICLFRGRGKGSGSKRTLWSKVAERSLGSLEGTRQQERHCGQPHLQEKSDRNSRSYEVIRSIRGQLLAISHPTILFEATTLQINHHIYSATLRESGGMLINTDATK